MSAGERKRSSANRKPTTGGWEGIKARLLSGKVDRNAPADPEPVELRAYGTLSLPGDMAVSVVTAEFGDVYLRLTHDSFAMNVFFSIADARAISGKLAQAADAMARGESWSAQ